MGYKHWTPEELTKLTEISSKNTLKKLSVIFGRSEAGVKKQCLKLGLSYKKISKRKYWSPEEEDAFSDDWSASKLSIHTLVRKYGRSKEALSQKAHLLGLPERGSDTYITLQDVSKGLGVKPDVVRNWEKKGLKVYRIKGIRNCLIDYDELLRFLKKHQDLFDAGKLDFDIFTIRPEWLRDKYFKDFNKTKIRGKGNFYTNAEDKLIQKMFYEGKSDKEIAKILRRTATAIKIHRQDLYLSRIELKNVLREKNGKL